MTTEEDSWLIEGCINSAKRAAEAGDTVALGSAVSRMEAFVSRWGSPRQLEEFRTFQAIVADMRSFESEHGTGSALNLFHPSVERLVKRGIYTETELHNAFAVDRIKPDGRVRALG